MNKLVKLSQLKRKTKKKKANNQPTNIQTKNKLQTNKHITNQRTKKRQYLAQRDTSIKVKMRLKVNATAATPRVEKAEVLSDSQRDLLSFHKHCKSKIADLEVEKNSKHRKAQRRLRPAKPTSHSTPEVHAKSEVPAVHTWMTAANHRRNVTIGHELDTVASFANMKTSTQRRPRHRRAKSDVTPFKNWTSHRDLSSLLDSPPKQVANQQRKQLHDDHTTQSLNDRACLFKNPITQKKMVQPTGPLQKTHIENDNTNEHCNINHNIFQRRKQHHSKVMKMGRDIVLDQIGIHRDPSTLIVSAIMNSKKMKDFFDSCWHSWLA